MVAPLKPSDTLVRILLANYRDAIDWRLLGNHGCTVKLVFNSDARSSPNWTPKVMRSGRGYPKKPAIAGLRIAVKYYTYSNSGTWACKAGRRVLNEASHHLMITRVAAW